MFFIVAVIAGYMLLLVGLAVASPGIGFTGSLLHLVPGDWRDAAHVPAYGLLAWLAMVGFRLRGWPIRYALLVGIAFAGVFGLWTEVVQGTAPGREASLSDLLNDLTGAMMAGALMLWLHSTSRQTDRFVPALRANVHPLRKGTSSK
ncbi:MAG: VanZ family protein [Nitrospira sp.]|nr:VanZ family protein [Nitrospira sp.]